MMKSMKKKKKETKMKSIKNVTIIAEAKNKILLTLETCVTIKIIQNTFTKRNSLLLECDNLAVRSQIVD